MVELHGILGWVVVALNLVVGLWALASERIEALRMRALWWAVGVAFVSVAVQVTIGAWLLGGEGREVGEIHTFYGFVAFASVGIVYSYRHQVEKPRLLFGAGALWIMGLALRTITLV